MSGGKRFAFGRNWRSFARHVDESRLFEAEASLRNLLGVMDLEGQSFLDVGCGSGLFTVAARRMGAQVTAFDFDADSVVTARELAARFDVHVEWLAQGDILDQNLLDELDRFDVVYSWGVLHHTGSMWQAIGNAGAFARPGGLFAIAIYNDEGFVSRVWSYVKRFYLWLPRPFRPLLVAAIVVPYETALLARDLARLRPKDFVKRWSRYSEKRGMSRLHDHIDWIGGYPFEVASPQQIVSFVETLGFEHLRTILATGRANNQFVFARRIASDDRN